MDHTAEVWWSGGCRKLDQHGSAGRSRVEKLEERREEMKVLFDKRLEGIEVSRQVKMVVERLRENGGTGWWENSYEVLRRV